MPGQKLYITFFDGQVKLSVVEARSIWNASVGSSELCVTLNNKTVAPATIVAGATDYAHLSLHGRFFIRHIGPDDINGRAIFGRLGTKPVHMDLLESSVFFHLILNFVELIAKR